MHCPSCGNESSLDQKFCRKCGFNLEPVSALLTPDISPLELKAEKAERERRLVRRMFRWISVGCLVLLLGVILLVINRGIVHEAMFQTLATLITLAGVSIAAYGLFSTMLRGTYLPEKSSAPKEPKAIKAGEPTNELPEARLPTFTPSITERTTQLIGSDAKRES